MILTEFHPESKHISIVDRDTREKHNMVVLFDTETKRAIVYATDKSGNVVLIKSECKKFQSPAMVHKHLTNYIAVDKEGNEIK